MNETKKLTEAALLSSLFIVATILIVGTGIGYVFYLDFIVPIFFCVICIKCDLKYTALSAISSMLIVFMVLGDIGTALWASQSVFLGLVCGYMMPKNTTVLDDILFSSIIGVIVMVFIDVYASGLIGYSFMKEFQGYMKYIPIKEWVNTVYYLMISLFVLGMVFSVYILSLVVCRKINILKANQKNKFYVIKNFRGCGRFLCCSKKVFYISIAYIALIEGIKLIGIEFNFVYLRTIVMCTQYLCMYFVIRDSFTVIQNFIMAKFQKILFVRLFGLAIIILLIRMFKITSICLGLVSIIIDKKLNIIIKQIDIINNYTCLITAKK